MGFLDRFKNKPVVVASAPEEQAVIVMLNGAGLDDSVYENFDLSTLEDQIINALQNSGLGEFDGNEVGPAETTLYMYGKDAEQLFGKVEPILRAYPPCEGAKVTVRFGKPGASQREVQL